MNIISQYFRQVFKADADDGESDIARGCSAEAVNTTSCPTATCASCSKDDCNVAVAVSKCEICLVTQPISME